MQQSGDAHRFPTALHHAATCHIGVGNLFLDTCIISHSLSWCCGKPVSSV